MAMFSNQQQYSQQIGGMGTGPGMQNPFPGDSGNMGSQLAGGAGMALPGIATGVSIGGSLMGGRAGWMDPMTGVARGFARGVGMGGAGFGTTLGHVGSTFASGGMRAGMGMMAGGMAGAAAMALPYAVAGAAIQTVGQNIYQGAQNVAEVGGMASQYMGSQYGQPGARPGGEMARSNIKGIVSAMHEIVSDDTRTSMDELKKVMDQAGRMGMLSGISSAQEFKSKFQKIVQQVRDVADIMGSSLEQAAPVIGQMRQMGLWKTGDILGTTVQGRVAGAGAGEMLQTMQTGSQMSHAMGGTMRAGAMMGRQSFSTVQAAKRAGVLSEEDVMEFTGGLGGAEGQRAIAERMTGYMSKFGESSAGRLMMAGLGETKEGVFTGEIDKDKLEKFQRGELDVNQLMGMGRKSARTREGKMSFFRQADKLGQNLGAEGGMEAMGQIVQQIADTKFGGSEQARHQLFQQMLGASNKDAEMMGKLRDESGRIKDQESRQLEDAINQTFQELDRKQNRSWEALKGSIGHVWQESLRPLQEFGESLATDLGETSDKMSRKIWGQVERIPMGNKERTRLLRGGALTKDLSQFAMADMGQSEMTGTAMSNTIRRMRQPGFAGDLMGAAAAGPSFGMPTEGIAGGLATAGRVYGNLLTGGALGMIGAGMELTGAGSGGGLTLAGKAFRDIGVGTKGGDGGVDMGGGYTTSHAEMEHGRRRAFMRAEGASASGLGIKDPAQKEQLANVRTKLGATIGKYSAQLAKTKRDNPEGYKDELLRLMTKDDPNLFAGLSETEKLDYLAAAQSEEGFGQSELAVDFKSAAIAVGVAAGTPEELALAQGKMLDDMAADAGYRNKTEQALVGAAAGGAAGFVLGGPLGAIIGAIGGAGAGLLDALSGDSSISRDQIVQATTGEGSDVFMAYIKDGDASKARQSLTRMKGGDRVRQLIDKLESDPKLLEKFKKSVPEFEGSRALMVQKESLSRIQGVAASGPNMSKLGLSEEGARKAQDLANLYKGGSDERLDEFEYGDALAESQRLGGELSAADLKKLSRGGGAVGRQVAAFGAAEGLGAMSGKELQKTLGKFRNLGYDLESLGGEEMQELLKDGVSEGTEASKFKELTKKAISAGLADTTDARKSANDKMMQMLDRYTDFNTKFVNAVSTALGKEGIDLKEEAEHISQEGKASSPAAEG